MRHSQRRAGSRRIADHALERDLTRTINATLVGSDAGDAKPAGLAYGAQTVTLSGSTAAQISADLSIMVDKLADAGASLDGAVWIT